MSTICDLINKYRESYMSKLSKNAPEFKITKPAFKSAPAVNPEGKNNITLLSWSIYNKLYNYDYML